MTGAPVTGWKNFEDGDEADNVPLWQVLAQFRAEDLDEGLKANAAIINQAKPPSVKYYNLAFVVSIIFGFLFVIFLIGFLISAHSASADLYFYLTLATAAATMAPHLWRQAYQYGLKTPDAPLELPHASDQLFDEVLGYLQKVNGPKAYYLSRFRKKRIRLKRRQFFGRLRYFLFSEHSKDRGMVMRFPTAMPLPADLYLHRDDLERLIALTKPKRKGGPGRNPKYAYAEAVIELIGDPRLDTLDLNDETAAIHSITDWLDQWFKAAADESGDTPRRDQLTPYAKKIYLRLRNLAAGKGR